MLLKYNIFVSIIKINCIFCQIKDILSSCNCVQCNSNEYSENSFCRLCEPLSCEKAYFRITEVNCSSNTNTQCGSCLDGYTLIYLYLFIKAITYKYIKISNAIAISNYHKRTCFKHASFYCHKTAVLSNTFKICYF